MTCKDNNLSFYIYRTPPFIYTYHHLIRFFFLDKLSYYVQKTHRLNLCLWNYYFKIVFKLFLPPFSFTLICHIWLYDENNTKVYLSIFVTFSLYVYTIYLHWKTSPMRVQQQKYITFQDIFIICSLFLFIFSNNNNGNNDLCCLEFHVFGCKCVWIRECENTNSIMVVSKMSHIKLFVNPLLMSLVILVVWNSKPWLVKHWGRYWNLFSLTLHWITRIC